MLYFRKKRIISDAYNIQTRRCPVDDSLTICTVSYGHTEHLSTNIDLLKRLNGGQVRYTTWKVADNAYNDDELRFINSSSNVQVINGSSDKTHGGSYHHADALGMLLKDVNSRFLLVLDPDFYLLKSNWIKEILTHMNDNNIAVFGAPWHPRYNQNYRYFPAVHCMFVDLARVTRERLDFRPCLDRMNASVPARRKWYDFLPILAKRRRVSWDTGTRIYEDLIKDASIKSEYVIQTFRHNTDYPLKTRLMQALLPDEYCYLPKDRSSYTLSGFFERGHISRPIPELWEETFWHDAPFGLHLRGYYNKDLRDKVTEMELLAKVLSELT